jgi:2-C-methyl-D-erythritol 4-phosphate cytidylyltransferase/2-C-methyl-D-erythritol 2,4-cyclodiphosphate synthase
MRELAVIITAAGRGTRAGGPCAKQWQDLCGRPVARRALDLFAGLPGLGRIIMVVHPDDLNRVAGWPVLAVTGGATRAESVRAGLEALADDPPSHVLIHDAARATTPRSVIDAVIKALNSAKGAAPGLPVTDALWTSQGSRVSGHQDRAGLIRAQTPQGFDFAAILAAHRRTGSENAADDVAIALAAGIPVEIVAGHEDNLKITHAADFARAARVVERQRMRIGTGFDIHRFGEGDHVTLGGIRVAHDRGISAHSDGDVVLHALADAIYGALAEGDIGQHFPPSEAEWQDADSRVFLAHAGARAALNGFAIANLDVTILAEAPKIAPHAAKMRASVARTLGLSRDQVAIKATTMEQLGPIGRGEGIAAQASVLLVSA